MTALTSPSNNTRVFYAMKALAIGPIGSTGVVDSWGSSSADSDFTSTGDLMIAHGLQSFGIDTNFNLEAVYEFGQLSAYQQVEDVPDVEITMEKVLDGYSLLYHLCTPTSVTPTLTGRGDSRCDVRMAVGLTTDSYAVAGNSSVAELYASGMYLSSVSYTLSTEGNFTESVSLVGNDKLWLSDDATTVLVKSGGVLADAFASTVFGNDSPDSPTASVLRRQNVVIGDVGKTYGGTVFRTVVPSFIEGGTAGATGVGTDGLMSNCSYIPIGGALHISSFSTSVDLGREAVNELGTKLPYNRYPNFPVDITTDLEVTAVGGDNINASSSAQNNLSDHSIQIVLDDSTVIQLGNKNKVTSVSYAGGDAGGGNDTITYSMTNANDFVILHSGDPMPTDAGSYFTNWF